MPRKLAGDVYLPPAPFGEAVRYRAGTLEGDLPDGVAKRIVNPAAWVDVEVVEEVEEAPAVVAAAPELDPTPAAVPVAGGLVEPPRGGSGSGREPWLAFASALGQVVTPDTSRDEIIEQLTDAGLIEREG